MLHPYSIFFKALWEDTEPAPRDDVEPTSPRPQRRLRARLPWRRRANPPSASQPTMPDTPGH